ncbi:MAG: histidine kinase [Bacteroidota bacterium]
MNKMIAKARIASFEIEQYENEKQNEIEHLQLQKKEQRNYYLIAGAFLLLIVMAVISLILYRRKRDKEQLTSDFKNQLARAETKALRAQMNPHFIFNSLNSINNFVTDQKHEIAFENHFKYVVNIAENTSSGSIMIPPMLLQPFIENAIWHGLMQKRTKGAITVDIRKENENFLHISITDDGIGREKAAEMKSKSATHQSHGLKVTSERIEMMNKLNSTGAQVHIIDLKDEQGNALGTRVELVIPF